MAIKKVLLLGDSELQRCSTDIQDFSTEVSPICTDLRDTLRALQQEKRIGRALAAPQIGYFRKVIYVNMPECEFFLINPEITREAVSALMLHFSYLSNGFEALMSGTLPKRGRRRRKHSMMIWQSSFSMKSTI